MLKDKIRVLLIEDDIGDADLIRESFELTENIRFTVCHEDCLSKAISRLKSDLEFDAVLLDLGLPDSQGLETFNRVYAFAPTIPLVVLSGNDDAECARKSVQYGAQDYLVKGDNSPRALARSVQYAIERVVTQRKIIHLNSVLSAIRQINHLICRETDRKKLIHSACNILVQTRSYKAAWIHCFRRNGDMRLTELAGENECNPEFRTEIENGRLPSCAQSVLAQDETIYVTRPAESCVECPLRNDDRGAQGVTARLESYGEVYGVMGVSLNENVSVGSEEFGLIEECATDIAFALRGLEVERQKLKGVENLKKKEESLQTALQDSRDQQAHIEALYKATRSILQFPAFEDAAPVIFEACKTLVGATCGYVALLSDDGHENEVLYLDSGGRDCDVNPSLPMPIRSLRERAYREKKAVFDNDFANSPWVQLMPEGHVPLHNVLFAPLLIQDKAVGLIGMAEKEGGFNESDCQAVTAFAEIAAVALKSSRSLESLRDSEELYSSLVETLPQQIFRKDREGRITFVNQNFCKFTEMSEEELIGKTDRELFPGEHADKYHHDDQRVMKTEQKFEAVETHTTKSGELRHVQVVKTPIRDAAGKCIGIQGISWDVTDRIQSEKSLQEREEVLRATIESTSEGILITNEQWSVRLANSNFYSMWNFPARFQQEVDSQALFQAIIDQVVAESLPQERIDELHDSTEVGLEEFETKNGRILELHSYPLVLSGSVKGRVWSFRDLTLRKQAERENDRLAEQLRQSQKMEAIGRLAGGIAHDFNNLLMVINGYSGSLIKSLDEDNPVREDIQEIYEAGTRAAGLTKQLLAFSRKQIVKPRVLSINQTLQEMDKLLHRVIGEDIALETTLDKDLGLVEADPSQIEQILVNMAVNSRDAMEKGGKLTIETCNLDITECMSEHNLELIPGPYIKISISDTGSGIDAETREKIFEPFFTTKEQGKGTGLGLSTVYGIIKQYSGHITVYSEVGYGTTFNVYLPRVDADKTLAANGTPVQTSGGKEKILLVEDESLLRKLLTKHLRNLGYDIITASNGKEALDRMQTERLNIDLLLTDVVMPEMGGPELAEKLKAEHPDLRCLFMSGYTDRAVNRSVKLDKDAAFLQKPCAVTEVSQAIREVLDKN